MFAETLNPSERMFTKFPARVLSEEGKKGPYPGIETHNPSLVLGLWEWNFMGYGHKPPPVFED
jgi:hypothetical protein